MPTVLEADTQLVHDKRSVGRFEVSETWPVNEIVLRSLILHNVPLCLIAKRHGVTIADVKQLCEEYGTFRETID